MKKPSEVICRAARVGYLNPESFDPVFWRDLQSGKVTPDENTMEFLTKMSGIPVEYWRYTVDCYSGKPFKGVPFTLMGEIVKESALSRFSYMLGREDCLWHTSVIASVLYEHFSHKIVNKVINSAILDQDYLRSLRRTISMLLYNPDFLSMAHSPEAINVYTDGGLKKNKAAWAVYMPSIGFLRSGIERKVKKSTIAEGIAIRKAYDFIKETHPDHLIYINTDCKSIYNQWQNSRFSKELHFLESLLGDSFIVMRWVSRLTAGISVADQACTEALNFATSKVRKQSYWA